jgi:hypothetical protein
MDQRGYAGIAYQFSAEDKFFSPTVWIGLNTIPACSAFFLNKHYKEGINSLDIRLPAPAPSFKESVRLSQDSHLPPYRITLRPVPQSTQPSTPVSPQVGNQD